MRLNPHTLQALRTALGLSQSALHRKSGVSQGYISAIEGGDRDASPETIHKFAKALGVTVAALVTDYDSETVREVAKTQRCDPDEVFPQPVAS